MASDYRLSPPLAARLMGVLLVLLGVLVVIATALLAMFSLPVGFLTVTVVGCAAAILVGGLLLLRRARVVRLDEDGYQVRFVRGAGVRRGRWRDVEDAVTTTVDGAPCVVLRLRDGSTTTIPVQLLAVDREQFVRDLQLFLERGHGYRPT